MLNIGKFVTENVNPAISQLEDTNLTSTPPKTPPLMPKQKSPPSPFSNIFKTPNTIEKIRRMMKARKVLNRTPVMTSESCQQQMREEEKRKAEEEIAKEQRKRKRLENRIRKEEEAKEKALEQALKKELVQKRKELEMQAKEISAKIKNIKKERLN